MKELPKMSNHVRARVITEFGASDGEGVSKIEIFYHFRCKYGRKSIHQHSRDPGRLEKWKGSVPRS